ncbi:MAG: hypothetical protein AAFY73_13155 [Pseudomonadota bacterium]
MMLRVITRALLSAALVSGAAAQEDGAARLSLELNSAETVQNSCRLTFVAENTLPSDLSSVVFETVLFTQEGAVERLTLFDLQDLPLGRPRVRQFEVQGITCDGLGRILINGVNTCTGVDLDPGACLDALSLSSRLENLEVIG